MSYTIVKNNRAIPLSSVPLVTYDDFYAWNIEMVTGHTERHCVSYSGWQDENAVRLISCIADDLTGEIFISSCLLNTPVRLRSLALKSLHFSQYEREIHENYDICFDGHPWLKPVRYPYNRTDKNNTVATYPFFTMESDELHEVGVGPIHAGVIEPGHFRFICNGEQILHLEIQLGYQHRGVEQLFREKKKLLQRVTLAESIAGDTVAGHTTAFSQVWESLCDFYPGQGINLSRTIALELERMAVHTGDLAALCADIGYQLGAAVFGRLRTPLINFFQEWCGNRLGKGLIRPGEDRYPFTIYLADRLREILCAYERDFLEMAHQLTRLPGALSRFERTGVVSYNDILGIGAVGMAARMSGLQRDIRASHPHGLYRLFSHEPVIKHHGDVYSRVQIRREEIIQSMEYLRKLTDMIPEGTDTALPLQSPKPDLLAISLVEGWRGEICHMALTGPDGEIRQYKIKDPSFHNWMALALAVRNNEISDFPVCNKSFNLSYCGNDL